MRKIICLFLALILCCVLCSCNDATRIENSQDSSLTQVNVVYDKYDNIVQQIFYNETTNEYIMKEYIYTYSDPKWICIDQRTTIISNSSTPETQVDASLNIYYKDYLETAPIVLIDNSDIKISIIEYLDKAGWWEFGYKFKVENKSTKVLTYTFDCVSIMDIDCKPMFSIDHVDSGHTVYFNLAWDKESLERAYIPYIDNIKFMVRVYDNENWDTPALYGTRALIKE